MESEATEFMFIVYTCLNVKNEDLTPLVFLHHVSIIVLTH